MGEHFHVLKNGAADVPHQKSYMEMNQLKKILFIFMVGLFSVILLKKKGHSPVNPQCMLSL